jgi:hypothetical protein
MIIVAGTAATKDAWPAINDGCDIPATLRRNDGVEATDGWNICGDFGMGLSENSW